MALAGWEGAGSAVAVSLGSGVAEATATGVSTGSDALERAYPPAAAPPRTTTAAPVSAMTPDFFMPASYRASQTGGQDGARHNHWARVGWLA